MTDLMMQILRDYAETDVSNLTPDEVIRERVSLLVIRELVECRLTPTDHLINKTSDDNDFRWLAVFKDMQDDFEAEIEAIDKVLAKMSALYGPQTMQENNMVQERLAELEKEIQ